MTAFIHLFEEHPGAKSKSNFSLVSPQFLPENLSFFESQAVGNITRGGRSGLRLKVEILYYNLVSVHYSLPF